MIGLNSMSLGSSESLVFKPHKCNTTIIIIPFNLLMIDF